MLYLCTEKKGMQTGVEQSLTIYRASAGSGKTFALVVEYIAGLLLPHAEREFTHTLAVTFTNKATAEMKGRILETLYALKTGLAEARPYREAITGRFAEAGKTITQEQISHRAGKALTAILHDYSHFRVETIDSFFQGILRGMARELGLAANLQVELSHQEVIDSAVDSLIETMDTRPEVKGWVLDYVREQLDNGDKWDIVRPLKAFAGNIFREEYQQRSQEELRRISDAEVIKAFKGKMHAIRQRALRDVEEAVDKVESLVEDFGKVSYGRNIRSFLQKARQMESDGPTKTTGEIRFKAPCPREAEAREAYARLLSLYGGCRREYLSATLALRHLAPLRLLEYIDERAREIEGDAGRFTLSSTPALLGKMVEGSDAPFIFEKTGILTDNVMIDEFQDTSRMQWENFKKLLFEKLASGGRGLLVGDIKQSIYRWRNGDWKILYGIEQERDLRRFHIQPKPLNVNYRSHQGIVGFNNMFFPKAAALLDAAVPGAPIRLSHIYEDVRQEAKKADGKGYVRVRLSKGDDASDIADQIRRLHADGLDLSQIAILVRTNSMARRLIEDFAASAPDIRLVSDEAFLLEASTSVQMIVAAMRMLIDRNHSDGISEKYLMLHYTRDVLGQTGPSFQHIVLQDAAKVLPEAFMAHRDELLGLPLYHLAERLWHIFSLADIGGEDVYVYTFFDELQNYLRGTGSPDIQAFLTAWDETLRLRSVPASSVDGVRILTIHKSKGLAFHTVMLPFSEWPIESDRQGDILWCKTDKAPYGELGALPIPIYPKDVRNSVFAPDYEQEHLERRVDALNTLYVAFTRAVANLYVWGTVKPHDKIRKVSTAAELVYLSLRCDESDRDEACFTFEAGSPLIATREEAPDRTTPEATERSSNRLALRHREEDAVAVRAARGNPTFRFRRSNQAEDYLESLKGQEAGGGDVENPLLPISQRETGKRMHEVLSRLDDVAHIDGLLSEARQDEGIIFGDEDWNRITARIKEGLASPLIASWFQTGNTVYNECSIAGTDERSGQPCVLRPDRVVMNGGSITVIDYKFGHPDGKYSRQVRAYMRFLRRMYPKHEVKGYLWYVMMGEAVPVHGRAGAGKKDQQPKE